MFTIVLTFLLSPSYSLSFRLLSEGPRLSGRVSSTVVPPPSVPETAQPAEGSQPPPYTQQHTYHHAPPQAPPSGMFATPPQQSLYAATSTDYSSVHQPSPAHHQFQGPPPPSQASMATATLSSSPGSWSQNIGQMPSLSAYSLPQQRYELWCINACGMICVVTVNFTPCSQYFYAISITDASTRLQYKYDSVPSGLHGNTGSSSSPLSTSFIVSASADASSTAPALIANHHACTIIILLLVMKLLCKVKLSHTRNNNGC